MDDKTKTGSLGEIKVLCSLIEKDFDVFIQFSGKAPFDMVAHKGNQIWRVEVKSTFSKNIRGLWSVSLRRIRSNKRKNTIYLFDNKACDILAIYIGEIDTICFLKSSEIKNKNAIRFRLVNPPHMDPNQNRAFIVCEHLKIENCL